MKLAYLTTCFGTPSHTFIRREIRELEKRGIAVELLGVRKDENIAADAGDLVERTRYLYPLSLPRIIALNIYFACCLPKRFWPCLYSCLFESQDSLKAKLKLVYHLSISAVHAKRVMDTNISHVHAHFLNVSASVAMFTGRLAKVPYSVTVHSAGEKNLPHVIGIGLKLKYAQSLLMISSFNIDYYNAIYPCRERSHVVRCGMDIDAFVPRKQQPINAPIKLLAVGRFVEKKGFHILLQAAALLRQRGFEFNLEILGYGPDYDKLERYLNEYDLSSVAELPGQASTEAVKMKMHQASAVIVPSVTSASGEMEGIPVVLMEAMASAVPVIASAHSGIPELVTEQTGDLVPEKDPEALANAIQGFQVTEQKIEAARSLILSQFNITRVVDQRLALFAD